jgi:hypothetical protein
MLRQLAKYESAAPLLLGSLALALLGARLFSADAALLKDRP